ncbi:MAG: hypothetical protein ICV62_06450 [Cyanobacteria bacterium Co-bin13]|nr:hypothetical protein [Cyanobacteria bacterium Co-bin13]
MTDSAYEHQINRLRDVMMRRWWRVVGLLWLVVSPLCLWYLRHEIALLRQHFTWTAVRYGLAYNRLPALGLSICIGMTVALLMAESRHILFGLSTNERGRLEKQLSRIRQKGPSHPLWRRVCQQ